MQVELEEEKKRAEALLCEVLPPSIAKLLTQGCEVTPGNVVQSKIVRKTSFQTSTQT